MRIEAYDHVDYEHNPLAEVVCQAQFAATEPIEDEAKAKLISAFRDKGYPSFSEEVGLKFTLPQPLHGSPDISTPPVPIPEVRVLHFGSTDGVWKVSRSQEFVALTCTKYTGWTEFLPRFEAVTDISNGHFTHGAPVRLGLRYKDVVEREALGLAGVGWHELIQPFLLGALSPGALAVGQSPAEDEVGIFLSQSLLKLDDAMLLLQSNLLTSIDGSRRAFLIDADFYNEGQLEETLLTDSALLTEKLNTLHRNAGALFRRCITDRLHHALKPRI